MQERVKQAFSFICVVYAVAWIIVITRTSLFESGKVQSCTGNLQMTLVLYDIGQWVVCTSYQFSHAWRPPAQRNTGHAHYSVFPLAIEYECALHSVHTTLLHTTSHHKWSVWTFGPTVIVLFRKQTQISPSLSLSMSVAFSGLYPNKHKHMCYVQATHAMIWVNMKSFSSVSYSQT